MGPSNPPYPVANHSTYPPSTQSSYPGPASITPATRPPANMVTTEPATTTSNTLNDDDIKASLRSAVEDKIRRQTRALFEQAQVIINLLGFVQSLFKNCVQLFVIW